ncbi:hypothetical protein [Nocardioides sp. SR21]|uniref:hypothetical protein n=1 Tax=Nocardioides sp. SR21 TaxID=2919501 RepID=UPI001FAA37EE|nr:hypothetical protein [Nocardioides sp. SR21]
MSASTAQHSYTIKEAAALTGLPDLDQLMWIACLAATGMSVQNMRQYVANGKVGPAAAGEQIDLLAEQQRRLAAEAEQIALRRRYVALKIDYWHAVEAGDDARAELLSTEARALADDLKKKTGKKH